MNEIFETTKTIHVRLREKQVAKIDRLSQQTRLNASQIFRDMIDAAEIVPAQFSVNLAIQSEANSTSGSGDV